MNGFLWIDCSWSFEIVFGLSEAAVWASVPSWLSAAVLTSGVSRYSSPLRLPAVKGTPSSQPCIDTCSHHCNYQRHSNCQAMVLDCRWSGARKGGIGGAWAWLIFKSLALPSEAGVITCLCTAHEQPFSEARPLDVRCINTVEVSY